MCVFKQGAGQALAVWVQVEIRPSPRASVQASAGASAPGPPAQQPGQQPPPAPLLLLLLPACERGWLRGGAPAGLLLGALLLLLLLLLLLWIMLQLQRQQRQRGTLLGRRLGRASAHPFHPFLRRHLQCRPSHCRDAGRGCRHPDRCSRRWGGCRWRLWRGSPRHSPCRHGALPLPLLRGIFKWRRLRRRRQHRILRRPGVRLQAANRTAKTARGRGQRPRNTRASTLLPHVQRRHGLPAGA